MLSYTLRRLAGGVVTLWVVSTLIFVATEALPGDIVSAFLGQHATPEAEAALRARWGLDRPGWVRYVDWLGGVVQGDFGHSLTNEIPLRDIVGPRLMNTFFMAGLAALVAVPVSVSLGILCATFPNGRLDRSVNLVAIFTAAVPDFLIAILLVMYFAVELHWFPAMLQRFRLGSDIAALGQNAYALVLPVLTLLTSLMAHIVRMTRAAVLDVLRAPFVEMAILKGALKWRVVLLHALPNAMGPIINVIALNLGYVISGVVVVEVIFTYPGLGRLLVDAISSRDVPLVQITALIFCATYVLLNLLADVLVMLANRRLRGA